MKASTLTHLHGCLLSSWRPLPQPTPWKSADMSTGASTPHSAARSDFVKMHRVPSAHCPEMSERYSASKWRPWPWRHPSPSWRASPQIGPGCSAVLRQTGLLTEQSLASQVPPVSEMILAFTCGPRATANSGPYAHRLLCRLRNPPASPARLGRPGAPACAIAWLRCHWIKRLRAAGGCISRLRLWGITAGGGRSARALSDTLLHCAAVAEHRQT